MGGGGTPRGPLPWGAAIYSCQVLPRVLSPLPKAAPDHAPHPPFALPTALHSQSACSTPGILSLLSGSLGVSWVVPFSR